jgi:hypothetical protein
MRSTIKPEIFSTLYYAFWRDRYSFGLARFGAEVRVLEIEINFIFFSFRDASSAPLNNIIRFRYLYFLHI